MMLSTEQLASLGVVFLMLTVTLMAIALLAALKEIVKEKTNWWHRKWRVESKLDDLERRVCALEDERKEVGA